MIELMVRYCLRFFHIKVPVFASIFVILALIGCGGSGDATGSVGTSPYALDNADAVVALPGELTEISGMAVLPDGSILANQDETGTVYRVNPSNGEITRKWEIAGKGDFEDLVVADSVLYLLLSDGDVLRLQGWMNPAPRVDTLKADVPKKCDAEALALEPGGKRLMVGCKDEAGKDIDDARAIFALSLDSMRTQVAYVIPFDSLQAIAFPKKPRSIEERANRLLYGNLDLSDFRPSAMAYHPLTGELYVLSSGDVARVIAVLRRDGRIAQVLRLPEDQFPQPEGLAFSRTGELFISNEGPTGEPTLLRYRYRTSQTVTTE